MICFIARPLHLRVISIGTALEKQFETRNFQQQGQRQVDTKDRQSNRQRDADSQTDWVGPRAIVEAWENIETPKLTENQLKISSRPAHSIISVRSQR
jgi:hypothetical protein